MVARAGAAPNSAVRETALGIAHGGRQRKGGWARGPGHVRIHLENSTTRAVDWEHCYRRRSGLSIYC